MNDYRIVVADSSESSREKICSLLQRRGYKIYQASDGAGAIRMARSVKPQIVLLDTKLWGMRAFEVADIIEGDGLSTVIFITNSTGPE
ncbi:MAG: response regulator, partial [Clostridiales bacterium]|nr:response regulator [Clostridiales bacterium]